MPYCTLYLANSEDPDEMQRNSAFHQGLHCWLEYNQSSGTEIYHDLEILTSEHLKYKMDNPMPIVS